MSRVPDQPVPVVTLTEDRAEEAAALLARSFRADPLFVHCCPDPEDRSRWLPYLFRWGVWQGILLGQLRGTAGRLDGVAGLLGPAGGHLTNEQLEQSGFPRGRDILGPEAWDRVNGRLKVAFDSANAALHRAVTAPHWYLDVLAVEPSRQGTGIGGALLRAVSRQADADGLPVALFTFQPGNLPLYRHHGYRVVCEGTLPGADLPWWGMCRDPRV